SAVGAVADLGLAARVAEPLTDAGADAAAIAAATGRNRGGLDLDQRLSFLVGSLRWAAISLGFLVVATRTPARPSLLLPGAALACFGVFETLWPAHLDPPGRGVQIATGIEAVLTAVVVATTG